MAGTLLFLDVDGPLNPYAAKPERRPVGYTTIRVPAAGRRPLRVWLHPGHGAALIGLGYELVWATSWMGDANKWIAPVLGLPELPFVDFGEALFRERPDGVHWKTDPLIEYAGGRAFVWVDDEQGELDHAWVAARHPGSALLHHVDPRVGLREDDLRALEGWLPRPPAAPVTPPGSRTG
ncbi:hypothetical protein [Streptomyces sp. NPDC089919]|uniref:hypothetical protein n=1 Tax=Streptomyces sp. NPDC089919 TaxID=3155188 RepID=UPI00343BB7E3